MTRRVMGFVAGAALMSGLVGLAASADAQTVRQQCTTKYQAAKAAGTLNGQSYNQFYSACAKEAKAGPAASEPAAAPAAAPTTSTAAAPAAPAAAGAPVFPTAISPKYANEKAGIARRKTCDDQYQANKATNGNGGLKWIQKGGGYYSECNKRLKS